jgi:hypothetical protein
MPIQAHRPPEKHGSKMADGYIIELTNPRAAEGKPAKEIWYAHIPDRKRAIRAVRKAAGVGKAVAVDIVRPERHRILLERLALLEGEVRPE